MKTFLRHFAISLLVGYCLTTALYIYNDVNEYEDNCIPARNDAQMLNGYER